MTEFSNQDEQFINLAQEEALKSPCLMQHGAIAVSGGKIIGRGHNHYRCKSRDGIIENSCTCHAEMAAIRDVLRTYDPEHTHYQNAIKVAKDQPNI